MSDAESDAERYPDEVVGLSDVGPASSSQPKRRASSKVIPPPPIVVSPLSEQFVHVETRRMVLQILLLVRQGHRPKAESLISRLVRAAPRYSILFLRLVGSFFYPKSVFCHPLAGT